MVVSSTSSVGKVTIVPARSARPGSAPVWRPPSTTSWPFTMTCSIPSGNCRGSSYVALARTRAASKTTTSAANPSRSRPRSRRPRRAAGAPVMRRTASSSDSRPSSRTNWPRMRGKRAVGAWRRLLAQEGGVGADHRRPGAAGSAAGHRSRGRGDLVHPQVLGEQQRRRWRPPHPGRSSSMTSAQRSRPPSAGCRGGEGAQPHVCPAGRAGVGRAARRHLACECGRGSAASARRSLRRIGPPACTHWRQLDQQPGRGPLVRVGVEGDVLAVRPRVVDQGQHLVRRAGERLAMVEVGDVGRPLPATPDLDRLAEGIQEPIAERVADVGVVEAAVLRRFLRSAPPARRWRRRRPADSPARTRSRRRPPPSPRAASTACPRPPARRRARPPSRWRRSAARCCRP